MQECLGLSVNLIFSGGMIWGLSSYKPAIFVNMNHLHRIIRIIRHNSRALLPKHTKLTVVVIQTTQRFFNDFSAKTKQVAFFRIT